MFLGCVMTEPMDYRNDNGETIEFNGSIDEIALNIQVYFDNKIELHEAKFIAGVFVEKQSIDRNFAQAQKIKRELDSWIDSDQPYQDAGLDTPLGYLVLQTSKYKMEAAHQLYLFVVCYFVFGDAVNYLGIFSIELIWIMLNSIRRITELDDKIVMSAVIDIDTGKKTHPIFGVSDISDVLINRDEEYSSGFNDERIEKSLQRLESAEFIKRTGNYWQIYH